MAETRDEPRICRTCGYALTDQERESYFDQCGPCFYRGTTR